MKLNLTKEEKNWILYDVGNSAFTLLIATIMPIYFNYLAGNSGLSDVEYMAYWGYATSIATLVVAFMGPICGTLAEIQKDIKSSYLPYSSLSVPSAVSVWESQKIGFCF